MSDKEEPIVDQVEEEIAHEPEPVDQRIRGSQGRPFMDDESILKGGLKVSQDFSSIDEEWDWLLHCIDELNWHQPRPDENMIHDKFCLLGKPDYLFDRDDITCWEDIRKAVVSSLLPGVLTTDLCP
tara:strand:+ start:1418 stop:1795 length:378 start_codon:yes stop_codon:yes gene_type:complete